MKIKRLMKIALIFIITMITIMNGITCIASTPSNFEFDGFEKTADSKLTDPVKTAIGAVLSVVRIVGTGIAIIILAVIGIKYMMAAPGDRADFKKSAVQYVIGAVVVFGASNILAILVPAFEAILPS